MIVYKCDLCDQLRECVQKNIDGKYYPLFGVLESN